MLQFIDNRETWVTHRGKIPHLEEKLQLDIKLEKDTLFVAVSTIALFFLMLHTPKYHIRIKADSCIKRDNKQLKVGEK